MLGNNIWDLRILFFVPILFLFSCNSQKNTSYRAVITNHSDKDIIVVYDDFDSKETIFSDCSSNINNPCSILLFNEIFLDQVNNAYSVDEFESIVLSLEVYYIDNENNPAYFGGSIDEARKYENWDYQFYMDDRYGGHEYQLIIEN